jgi:hypothetical protein
VIGIAMQIVVGTAGTAEMVKITVTSEIEVIAERGRAGTLRPHLGLGGRKEKRMASVFGCRTGDGTRRRAEEGGGESRKVRGKGWDGIRHLVQREGGMPDRRIGTRGWVWMQRSGRRSR